MQSCEDCPLKGQPRVPGSGMPGGIAVVGEAPGSQEVSRGQPFVGLSGQLLRETLMSCGIDVASLYITNSCLCHPDANATPTPAAIDSCRQRLIDELKRAKVTKVLSVGATALEALSPETKTGIMKNRGTWLWHDELQCYVLPTVHPAYVLRNPDAFQDFVGDVQSLKRLPTEQIERPVVEYSVVETVDEMIAMIDGIYALDSSHLALDIETTGLSEFDDRILCIGIAADEEHIWILPDSTLKYRWAKRELRDLFEDEDLCWCAQNGYQFDTKFLKQHLGVEPVIKFDTMLAHYALDERQSGHGLKNLARLYFQADDYAAELDKTAFEDIPRDKLYQYLAYDCYYTWKLVIELNREMTEDEVTEVHDRILLPGARALGHVEHTGVRLDTAYLLDLGETLDREYAEGLAELRQAAEAEAFNPNSPKQVGELLYAKLGLKKAGSSTDKETLESLGHPLADKILDLRQKTRLRSTYVTGLLDRVGSDGRIHGDFLLFGTVTGRLSSRDPNLQNIPTLLGPIIKNAFVPSDDWLLIEADYSQLELRVATYFSNDPKLIDTYLNDRDIHTQVASDVFHVPLDQVTSKQRYIAKYVDFGILYGRGAQSLAYGELKCSVNEAQSYINGFLGQYPELARWMKRVQRQALSEGFVRSAFGRKRRFPIVLTSNKGDVERQAVNSPIQSTASDICLGALTRLDRRLDPAEARILLTVHDSIVLETRADLIDDTLDIVYEEMEQNVPLDSPVPFKVDVKVGERWGTVEKRERRGVVTA